MEVMVNLINDPHYPQKLVGWFEWVCGSNMPNPTLDHPFLNWAKNFSNVFSQLLLHPFCVNFWVKLTTTKKYYNSPSLIEIEEETCLICFHCKPLLSDFFSLWFCQSGFELTKKRSRRYPATTITDADYADDIAILANTPDQAETLLHSLERAATSIGLYVNAHKTEYMCYNQTGDISTLEGTPLKLVDKFTYLGSSVESTKKDIETRLTKAWIAINRLSTIWKSDLTDKMKRSFFQAAVTSILLYGCTTWTLTKRLEKKLDGNYTRMLRAILNKSWRQHPTRHQLYGHLPPITKTIQVRRTRHAGHCWRSRDELIRDVLLWTPTQDDQHEHTFSSYVRIRDAVLKTCLERWTIGRSGERGSGISVLPARYDDDDDVNSFILPLILWRNVK